MSNAPSFDRHSGGEVTERSRDARIAALAGRQHGVVAGRQLRAVGVGPDAITYRRRSGRLHEVHRGVYAVGHSVLTMRGRWMAAVLAAGPDAVLSHRAAAALWGIRNGTAIEVTSPRRCRRPGILADEAAVPPDERPVRDGIPTTTVARTLLDLAAVEKPAGLERAMNETELAGLADAVPLGALVARHPTRQGIRATKRALATGALGLNMTRSDVEEAFLAFARERGLPRPATNVDVLGFECDAVFWDQRVVVELDSRAHDTNARREADVARDRTLMAAGWRVVRVTWRQMTREAVTLERALRAILAVTALRA